MECVIYVRHGVDTSIYEQWNVCARYAARYGYSIKHKVWDIRGDRFQEAIDKALFDDNVESVIVYNNRCIGDFETSLFYKIYLGKFGKNLISCA